MKRKLIIPVISMLCVLLFAACSSKKSESEAYLNVLPDNSLVIAKMDFGKFLDESEILGNTFIKSAAGMGISLVPEDMRTLLQSIYDNPTASGININAPVYLAVTNVDPAGVVIAMAMDNMEAFENALLTFGSGEIEIVEQDGMKHIVTNEDEVSCAYDSDKLILVVDDRYADVTVFTELAADDMAVNDKRFKNLFDGNDDQAAVYDLGAFGKELIRSGEVEPEFEPYIKMLKGCVMYVTVNFEKGYACQKVYVDMPKEYRESLEKLIKKPTRSHFGYIPANSFAVFNCNLDLTLANEALESADVKEVLEENGVTEEMAREILKAVSGEYTAACWADGGDFENIQGLVAVECNDRIVFDMLMSLVNSECDVTIVDSDVYALNVNKREQYNYYTYEYETVVKGCDYYLMYKNGVIMLLPENLYNEICATGELKPLVNNINKNGQFGSMGNLMVDFKPARDAALVYLRNNNSSDVKVLFEVLDMFKSLTIDFDVDGYESRLNVNDDSVNSLKYLTDKIISIVVQNGGF